MNNCKRIQKLLPAYYYNELGREDACLVKEHLESCDRCAPQFEKMESMLDLVSKTQLKHPPNNLLDAYMSELNEKMERRVAGRSQSFSFIDAVRHFLLQSRVRTGVAAATVIVILFGLFFFHDSNKIGFGLLQSPQKLTDELALMELVGEEEDIISDTEEVLLTEMILLAELTTTSTPEETEIEDIEDELELLESLGEDEELWIEGEEDVLDELLDLDELVSIRKGYLLA